MRWPWSNRWLGQMYYTYVCADTAVFMPCAQVLYQPSWIGYGKTLGEEGEQFFSYWSKHAATTRNQSRAGALLAYIDLVRRHRPCMCLVQQWLP